MRSLCRFLLAAVLGAACSLYAQPSTVIVNGTPLVGARPPVQQAGEYFIALVPVARYLAATVSFGADRSLHIRLADGTEIDYDGRSGDIRSGIVFIGHVRNYASVQWSGDPEQVLFPISAIVSLLSVEVREDDEHKTLTIDAITGAPIQRGGPRFSLADLDYTYGVITNGRQFGQYANAHGRGLFGNATLSGLLVLNRVPRRGFLVLNQAALRADLPGHRTWIFGDQATFGGVDAMTNAARGVSFERPLGDFTASFYGGLAVGSVNSAFGSSSVATYDTVLGGMNLRRRRKVSDLSFSTNLFRNSRRTGVTLGGAFSHRAAKNQLNLQLAGGWFSGLSSRTFLTTVPLPQTLEGETEAQQQGSQVIVDENGNRLLLINSSTFIPVRGPAIGFSASETYTPFSRVSVSGRWDYYSKNFLTAREATQFGAESRRSLTSSIRPLRLLTLTAGATDRAFLAGDTRKARSYNYGSSVATPGLYSFQFGYFRSLQFDPASPLGRFDFNQYSLTLPSTRRFSGSVLYSETQFGAERVKNWNAFANYDKGRIGNFGATWTSQAGSYQRVGGDWRRSLGSDDAYLRIGADVVKSQTGLGVPALSVLPLVGMKLHLPRGQRIQISYRRDLNTNSLLVELNGPIGRRNELVTDAQGSARVIVAATLAGRVFLDTNANSRFDGADERGIEGLRVWLDDTSMVETDKNGNYRFDGVTPGTHMMRAELSGVPAGYIFAGVAERSMAVFPYRANRQDLAVIKTAQIRGTVTLLDYSDDPDDPVRRGFPDARIVATGDRDTYSEVDGAFLLGDLPPQRYLLTVDQNTIPSGYVAKPSTISVETRPGETATAAFELVIPPKPVLHLPSLDQHIELPAAPVVNNQKKL